MLDNEIAMETDDVHNDGGGGSRRVDVQPAVGA